MNRADLLYCQQTQSLCAGATTVAAQSCGLPLVSLLLHVPAPSVPGAFVPPLESQEMQENTW